MTFAVAVAFIAGTIAGMLAEGWARSLIVRHQPAIADPTDIAGA